MSYNPAEALTEFREKYAEAAGVREINSASYTKRPGDPSVDAIEVIVEPGFKSFDLPAAFRGYDVVIRDTNDVTYVATGPLE
jgi:hypothetical protein